MNKKYILALDQGTSSSRAILFNKEMEIVAIEQLEFPQYYPQAGWVEHEPVEIWTSQFSVAKNLISKTGILPDEIASIGITNQRETTILWDKKNGRPVYRAIVWQDRRTTAQCNKLKESGLQDYIKENTGLVIDSYFSATKVKWILDNVKGIREKAEKNEIAFGTVDSWLVWNLTGGKLHITDYSNASRTMFFNIKTLKWDDYLLEQLNIPKQILPEVRNSSEYYGTTDSNLFNAAIPISGMAGDQQAALFGQCCFYQGLAKNTYGTGCFMLMNTGENLVKSAHGMLSTIAWGINNKIEYALEGSVFIAGAAIKWLRDGLRIIKSASETENIALSLNSTEGVYIVPAFAGLGAPYWNMDARGAIVGITQGITDKHLVRATLESIAYQTKDILDIMMSESGIQLQSLYVDGGASANNFLMQFQSDILNKTVIRPQIIETTGLGAAFFAALAIGFWKKEDLSHSKIIDRRFEPAMHETERTNLYKGWIKAVRSVSQS